MLNRVIQKARSFSRRVLAVQPQQNIQFPTDGAEILLKKAVIVHVTGGLANQMICYKAARMVSNWNNAPLILDCSAYGSLGGKESDGRNFQLHYHRIRYEVINFSPGVLDRIRSCNNVFSVTREMLAPTPTPLETSIVNQVKNAPIVYFDFWFAGFLRWEADRDALKTGVLAELTLEHERCFSTQDHNCMKIIEASDNPVAVHVRRGDFATHGGGLLLPADYYNRSIREMEDRLPSRSFFVFSDDIQWCRKNLSVHSPIHFVHWNDEWHGHKDMFLASRCAHFILSNESTYSHHIVQLAKPNPNRIVITSKIEDVIPNVGITS